MKVRLMVHDSFIFVDRTDFCNWCFSNYFLAFLIPWYLWICHDLWIFMLYSRGQTFLYKFHSSLYVKHLNFLLSHVEIVLDHSLFRFQHSLS